MNFYHDYFFFFFNDTATTEIYTLSLHDALPIYGEAPQVDAAAPRRVGLRRDRRRDQGRRDADIGRDPGASGAPAAAPLLRQARGRPRAGAEALREARHAPDGRAARRAPLSRDRGQEACRRGRRGNPRSRRRPPLAPGARQDDRAAPRGGAPGGARRRDPGDPARARPAPPPP